VPKNPANPSNESILGFMIRRHQVLYFRDSGNAAHGCGQQSTFAPQLRTFVTRKRRANFQRRDILNIAVEDPIPAPCDLALAAFWKGSEVIRFTKPLEENRPRHNKSARVNPRGRLSWFWFHASFFALEVARPWSIGEEISRTRAPIFRPIPPQPRTAA
jgi:hypothetical protein